MTIQSILAQVAQKHHPLATAIQKGKGYRVLAIAFKKGMQFKEHMIHLPTRIAVISGIIIYRENEKKISLKKYDELEIPVNVIHSMEALEDSLCLLIQG